MAIYVDPSGRFCMPGGYLRRRTSENAVTKLSEKFRRHPKRGPTWRPNRPFRPVMTPIHVPNTRPERHPNPFSDSFTADFSELREAEIRLGGLTFGEGG